MTPARLAVAVALLSAAAAAPAAASPTPDARPATIPALRSWDPGRGHFVLRRDARVVAIGGGGAEARTLAGDLARLGGRRVPVTRGRTSSPRRRRARDRPRGRALGREGYRLRIGRWFEIDAAHPAGAFYGGQTLVQLLRG